MFLQQSQENIMFTFLIFQLSEMTLDHDEGPAPTGSEEAPSGEERPAVKPRRKEKRKSEMRDITSQMSSMNTAFSTRYDPLASRYGGALMNNPYMNGDDDEGMYRCDND